jgi:tetratricopeptide (TPR) repeat protein
MARRECFGVLTIRAGLADLCQLSPMLPFLFSLTVVIMLLAASSAGAQASPADWHGRVRELCEKSDWTSALRIVEQEIAHAPSDVDVRAWRARVLAWSGNLSAAELEYQTILSISARDPDIWLGLAGVYTREGKHDKALQALETAVQLDPKRADLRAARARALRAAGERARARAEFQEALRFDPHSAEARSGLISLGREPRSELRLGGEADFLSYTAAYEGSWVSLVTHWTPKWGTSVAENVYQRGGVIAEKFTGSVTAGLPQLGALTLGGAVAHDNSVIPKSEAFLNLDHGWKVGEVTPVRGIEFAYGQHWYWYQTARILTLNGTAVVYFARDWSFSLGAIGARSSFSSTGTEWRPSGTVRLGFPLLAERLSGNVFFAAGTENFAAADQIGKFASQTYGGGLRFRFTPRQDINLVSSYQKRTQDRTDTYLGVSYGIRF